MYMKHVCLIIVITASLPIIQAGHFIGNYYVSTDKVDWFAAQRFCTYHGMYLIDIPHEVELKNILDLVKKLENTSSIASESIWTSGTRLNDEQRYYWATTGQPLEFQNWVPGDPNYGVEKCMIAWHGDNLKFADHMCTNKFIFICRKHQVNPFFNHNLCNSDNVEHNYRVKLMSD